MVTEREVFVAETIDFFRNTNLLCKDILPSNFHGKEKFEILIDETFNVLLDNALQELQRAIYDSLSFIQGRQDTFGRKDQFDLLYLELSFFNTRFDYINSNTIVLSEIKTSDKIENASVVLKSVKDLISRLPNWLQKVITVLGEILGIAKTFY
jgi:hypothetical protein